MTGLYNWIGFVLVAVISLVIASSVARRSPHFSQSLVVGAITTRIFGSWIRFEVLMGFYDGVGDAGGYYRSGLLIARHVWNFDLPGLAYLLFGQPGRWWGTPFMQKVSGLAVTLIGPTMRGEFLFFALCSFLGILAFTLAVQRVQPGYVIPYATFTWLWPSVWFWPSSIGKEAVVVLAMGLLTLGYVGRDRKPNWLLYLVGLGLAFAVRPHIAVVLALATTASYWLGSWRKATPRRFLEVILALVVAVAALYGMRAQFGLLDADLEGMREFVEFRSEQTLQGGSNIGTVPLSGGGLLMAFVNIWMRPFLWEFHNFTSLIAALEIAALWVVVFRQRKHLRFAVKHWRNHRLLRFALPLLFGYTLMIGLAFGNLGIIARQRVPLFPVLFMVLFAAPEGYAGRQRLRTPDQQASGQPAPATARRRRR